MKPKKILLPVCVTAMALGISLQGQAQVAGCEPASTQAQQDALLQSAPDFQNPPVYDFTTNEATIADMTVKMMSATLAGCATTLRNYGGAKYDGRPVGPTMRIKPGQQYLGLIDNQLPPPADGKRLQSHGGESTSSGYVAPDGAHAMLHNVKIAGATKQENEINKYKFNITNLHTHGWHVSPTQNHDNIFAEIHPGDKPYLQQVVLPDNHVAGTFWYHAHVHGSTTIQVASGMVGALIVEDEKAGLDPVIGDVADKIFVFQQLAYDENGEVNDYANLQQIAYTNLNRPVFVNGQAYPKIHIKRDEVQRWRFIHAGITDGIQPMLVADYTDSANTPYTSLWEVALDGLPTGEILPISYADMAPGYRVDVLVQLDDKTPDVLYLIDQGQAVKQSTGAPNIRRILAQIIVSDGPSVITTLPSEKQVEAAKNNYIYGTYKPNHPDPFRGMGPLNDITHEQLTGKNQFVHFLASNQYQCPPQGGSCKPCLEKGSLTTCDPVTKKRFYMVCDGKEPVNYTDDNGVTHTNDIWSCFNFNPSTDFARTLALDTASMWQVSGQLGGAGTATTPYHNTNHTFHIHVNPFMVQRKFVNSAYSADDGDTWVWKDTLRTPTVAFPTTSSDGSPAVSNGVALGPATLKSRYTEFTGAFVQHCHVLNHEDQGMMQVVEVVPAHNDLDDNPADSEQAGNHMH